jgi:hypothetical protein
MSFFTSITTKEYAFKSDSPVLGQPVYHRFGRFLCTVEKLIKTFELYKNLNSKKVHRLVLIFKNPFLFSHHLIKLKTCLL